MDYTSITLLVFRIIGIAPNFPLRLISVGELSMLQFESSIIKIESFSGKNENQNLFLKKPFL